MSIHEIIELVGLIISVLALIGSIVYSIIKGKLKDFIIEKMEEAEALELGGQEKLNYVLEAIKEKYKIAKIILNSQKFIEKVIAISKKINFKK